MGELRRGKIQLEKRKEEPIEKNQSRRTMKKKKNNPKRKRQRGGEREGEKEWGGVEKKE